MFQQYIKYAKGYLRKDLFQVIYHITFKCNSKCKHCFNWKFLNRQQQELDLKEIDDIARKLPSFSWLMFSGGEPFLRDDIDKIVEIFYQHNDIKHITIPTNGLLTEKIREKVSSIIQNKN